MIQLKTSVRMRTLLKIYLYIVYRDCDPEPSVFSMLNGKPLTAHLLMRRIPMEEVPDDPEQAAQWLHRLYQHKVLQLILSLIMLSWMMT